MDLSTLNTVTAANAGAVLELAHPTTGTPLRNEAGEALTITLLGVDSDAYRKAQRAAQNKRLAKRGGIKLTAEELEAESIETLAACTVAWANIEFEGRALECNRANAVKLYTALPWVREQVDAFMGDRANFLG